MGTVGRSSCHETDKINKSVGFTSLLFFIYQKNNRDPEKLSEKLLFGRVYPLIWDSLSLSLSLSRHYHMTVKKRSCLFEASWSRLVASLYLQRTAEKLDFSREAANFDSLARFIFASIAVANGMKNTAPNPMNSLRACISKLVNTSVFNATCSH